jgi:class 3 adenylate cyclase
VAGGRAGKAAKRPGGASGEANLKPVAQLPRTRYAKCGDMDIAYQILGDGPVDLVMLPGPLITIDSIDAEPSLYRFHRRLASFSRLIRFDYRGMGLSSHGPISDPVTPARWAEDAIVVMDAAGCEKATIVGSGLTAMSGFVLAADYPERVRSLVIINGAARVLWAPDFEIGAQLAAANPFSTVAIEPDALEQGFDVLGVVAPSVGGDDVFRAWWDSAGNRAMPPSMARVVSRAITESDVRDRLARITAPTLILHRKDSPFVRVGHGRYLSEHIAGSRYVELPGADALHWVGDAGPMLDEIEEFITGRRGGFDTERLLTTIVFTDIVGSTRRAADLGDLRWHHLLDNHDKIVRHQLERFGGREVNTAGDGFVARFTSPSVALDCADAIVDAVRPLGIEVRAGVHAGEVEVRGDDIAGMAVHIGARVAALAEPSQVLVSSTVREIVTGSRRMFTEQGEHELKGVPGRWRVYSLVREQGAAVRQ